MRSALFDANKREPRLTFIGKDSFYALDFCYVSRSIRVLSAVDPSDAVDERAASTLLGALPNKQIPSDHMPIVTTLEFDIDVNIVGKNNNNNAS